MKKVLRVFALFVAVFAMASLTSCKKDNADLIIGKWQFDKATITVTVDDPTYQEFLDAFFGDFNEEMNEEMKGATLEFKSDNTLIATSIDSETHETETDTYSYTVEGDKLSFDGEVMTITTLTKKSLVLEMSDTFDEDGISGKVVEILEFKR